MTIVNFMQRAAEWYALATFLVVGLSHIVQAVAWADVFAKLARLGAAGALVNGLLNLIPGAAFVAAHPVWHGPAAGLTVFGCAMILKGAVCLLLPRLALRSMVKAGASDGRPFIVAGAIMLAMAGYVGFVLW
jgi:hypothetical protein